MVPRDIQEIMSRDIAKSHKCRFMEEAVLVMLQNGKNVSREQFSSIVSSAEELYHLIQERL